jgi:hypothetical protein
MVIFFLHTKNNYSSSEEISNLTYNTQCTAVDATPMLHITQDATYAKNVITQQGQNQRNTSQKRRKKQVLLNCHQQLKSLSLECLRKNRHSQTFPEQLTSLHLPYAGGKRQISCLRSRILSRN